MSPTEVTLYMSIWVVLGVAISCLASQSIYGLRVQVAQAQKLGQYSLGELIGEGGMGVVYKAQHALLRRPTAIKLLHSELAGPHMLKRFEREVQMTAMLTHPNTINIYDFGRTADGTFYYAMEYLDGINLEQLVTQYGPQDCRRVVHILEQVAGSLSEAHQIGLVHRDIKPANVILCNRGGLPDVAKVVDFGLVKNAGGSTESDPSLTGINTIIGTPLYLPPEGITSPNTVDARSDLYALGALAYYLIAGVPVFAAATVVEICVMHANMQPVPPSLRAGREVPASLEALILRCLAKSPQDRPQTAEELLEELSATGVARWPLEEAREWWTAHKAGANTTKRSPSLAVNATTNPDTVIVNYKDRNGVGG
jgi:serine/threonine-protein kinase